LNGGEGNDRLHGNNGADILFGGAGRDVIKGGTGDDRLNGGEGNDLLFGGKGADTFVFAENAGDDRVYGFENGRDKIDLTAFDITFQDLDIECLRGGHANEVTFDGGSILVINLDAQLMADDFLF